MPRGRYDHRKEWHGASHTMLASEQTQRGDPLKPHGVPRGYEHPQPLGGDVLEPGGPRIQPASQAITHGPQQDREEAFEQAIREGVADMATYYGTYIFRDRREEGRRHRGTDNVEDLFGPQEPPPRGGWQRDVVPFERYLEN